MRLQGQLTIDAAGTPARAVGDGSSLVVHCTEPAELIAESLVVRRAIGGPARLTHLPFAVELRSDRGRVLSLAPGRGRWTALRIRRPIPVVVGWWRSHRR